MSIANYLLFPLEDHHSSTFVSSGQEFSCRVELNCGYDVSWKRGIEDDIVELQEFTFNNLDWDTDDIYKIIKRNTEKLKQTKRISEKERKKHK